MTMTPDSVLPPEAAPAPEGTTVRPPVAVWDVVLTIVLLAGLAVVAAGLSFAGLMLSMSSDSCSAATCNLTVLTLGVVLGVGLPWVAVVAALVVSIVRLVRRRRAFWVPLAAVPVAIAGLAIGAAIVFGVASAA